MLRPQANSQRTAPDRMCRRSPSSSPRRWNAGHPPLRTLTPGVVGTVAYAAPEIIDEQLQVPNAPVDRLLKVSQRRRDSSIGASRSGGCRSRWYHAHPLPLWLRVMHDGGGPRRAHVP